MTPSSFDLRTCRKLEGRFGMSLHVGWDYKAILARAQRKVSTADIGDSELRYLICNVTQNRQETREMGHGGTMIEIRCGESC